jgi:NAD(P)-dependent dehydrogenase (short-subunit alcohol dehydrogenase family)
MSSHPLDRFRLDGKTVAITGASSGFGHHFAGVLSAAGASVVLGARRVDRIEARVEELRAGGARALGAPLDVRDGGSIAAFLDAAWEAFGSLDVLVGNEEDFQLCLGVEGPEAGGSDIAAKIESFKEMINRVKEQFPNASVYGTTLREVLSVNLHEWGGIVADGDDWHVIEPREIGVLDRIGGGDGFVGGLLYGILRGWEGEKCAQFGWASGALAATLLTDYGQPADEDQVWSIWKGNARVQR